MRLDPIREDLQRAVTWLETARTILEGYEQLLAEGDTAGAREGFKAFREALRTAEGCAFEACP
jgi:hypothetical protein